ncbi:MAG: phosphoglucomutase/phosphomannomutase family protein [Dehalococcoidia bacterium]|nr:phosphoglucomutase/phosphomannomutase family protein [Dehalococcoidia bacterium]
MPIKFGTDGWRGVIAEDFTFGNVRLCAQGTADMLSANGDDRSVVVGYDTRFGSERFAVAVVEVFAGNGLRVLLADRPTPTPAIGFNVVAKGAGSGVVITASHNPPEWNGYKFKPDYGGSASPEIVAELERYVGNAERLGQSKVTALAEGVKSGLVEYFNPEPLYLENLRRLVDLDRIRRAGLRIVVDSMHGSGGGYLAKLVSGGSTSAVELRGDRNPSFPGMAQPEPLPQNLAGLIAEMAESNADVGLATDGDADRLGVVDESGRFVTTLEAFALLCYYQLEVLGNRGPLVRSITMTSMIDKLGKAYGVPVFDTPVGFKYLGPVMMREDALTAGEESGGYAFRGNIPERDGILSGLMILDLMVGTGKTVSELLSVLRDRVGPHYYDRLDLHFDAAEREAIAQRVASARPLQFAGRRVEDIDTRDGYRFILPEGFWTLIRFSGTEPLLRIYAEGDSPNMVRSLLSEARSLTGV